MKNLINQNQKIYVAGHTGMAGKAICQSLRNKGYSNLTTSLRKDLDLRNINQVENFFVKNKPEIVIISAARVGGISANTTYPVNFLLDNMKIQNNLIELSQKYKVKRLLFLGSSCIYPKECHQPIREEYLLNGPLEPTNEWYAIAKISGIKLCQALRKQFNFDAISLMPTNMYGPGDNYHPENSHVVAALIKRFYEAKKNQLPFVTCWGSGSPIREFLHSSDLGDACVYALEKWDPDSENAPVDEFGKRLNILNVGTGEGITIRELVYSIARNFDYKGEINWDESKPDGMKKKVLDVTKLKSIGWKAKINLNDGLKSVIDSISEKDFLTQR